MTSVENNKRIAKNTLFLYVRMIFLLIISLYTSRVVLSALGADDFGIYNVVGGVVVLFSFLTNSLTTSTQRFLNYNLGLNEQHKIKDVFNTSVLAHFVLSVIVLLLAETIGIWFLNNQLNIPLHRMSAALWVYQMSVVATIFNIMVIPYRASIIATEKMSIFAYMSIAEAVLKLAIVIYLPYASYDKLITYAILISFITFFNYYIYRYICRRKIYFANYHYIWNKIQFKEQISFSGWYLFGGIATVGTKQGFNFFINIFFNVAVNAAVGISNQVRAAVYGFVTSFQTAFNPQIVKLYASGQEKELIDLIYRSSKFSYFLMYILSLPLLIFCDEILSLWLVNVPEYTSVFTQLVILTSFTEALSAPLWTAIGATGKVKRYQFWVSLIIILNIPIIYVAFKLGYDPTSALFINLFIDIIAYVYRLVYIKKYVSYTLNEYLRKVLFPCLLVTLLALPVPFILKLYFSNNLIEYILNFLLTVAVAILSTYLLGLSKDEKNFLRNKIIHKVLNR